MFIFLWYFLSLHLHNLSPLVRALPYPWLALRQREKSCVQPPYRVPFDPSFLANPSLDSQRELQAVFPLSWKKLVPKQMKEWLNLAGAEGIYVLYSSGHITRRVCACVFVCVFICEGYLKEDHGCVSAADVCPQWHFWVVSLYLQFLQVFAVTLKHTVYQSLTASIVLNTHLASRTKSLPSPQAPNAPNFWSLDAFRFQNLMISVKSQWSYIKLADFFVFPFMCLISGFDPQGKKWVIIVIHHFLFLAELFSFYQKPVLIASFAIWGFVLWTHFSSYLIFFDARLLSEVKDQWSPCH